MKHILTFFIFSIAGLSLQAQNNHHLMLKGDLLDVEGQYLDDVRVVVVDQDTNDTIQNELFSKKCKVDLPLDKQFRITFSHPNYLDKYLTCDTDKSFAQNYKFEYDVYLGKTKEPITMYDKPVGHIEFNYPKNSFVYNTSITKKRMQEYNALLVTSNP